MIELRAPNILLYNALETFKLWTHVRAGSRGGDGLGQSTRLVGVGQEALGNGVGAFLLAPLLELLRASEIISHGMVGRIVQPGSGRRTRTKMRHGSTVLVFVPVAAQRKVKVLARVLAFHVLCLVLWEHCYHGKTLCLLFHSSQLLCGH